MTKSSNKRSYLHIATLLLGRAFAGNLAGLGFLQSVSYIKSIPSHEQVFAVVGKSGPNANFNLFFLGLGWPWVGEFVGFHNDNYVFSNPT